MDRNGQSIYESDLCQVRRSNYASFTRKGNTLYMHVHFWPGDYVALSGLRCRVKTAHLMKDGTELKFSQGPFQTKITNLPEKAPDSPLATIVLECDAEPTQDTDNVRKNKPRATV
jgi:alpha-L-fucosidase